MIMRKILLMFLFTVCVGVLAAAPAMADEAADVAGAKEAGLEYFRALVNADAETVFTLVTAKFGAEIKDPAKPKYSHLTALLMEYPQSLQVLATKTSFEFIDTDKFDKWIDVNLEVVTPDMNYIGQRVGAQMPMEDTALAAILTDMLAAPELSMEKSKVELEMVLDGDTWKVAAHTDFVGEPVEN